MRTVQLSSAIFVCGFMVGDMMPPRCLLNAMQSEQKRRRLPNGSRGPDWSDYQCVSIALTASFVLFVAQHALTDDRKR